MQCAQNYIMIKLAILRVFIIGFFVSPWFLGLFIQLLIYLKNTKRLIKIIKKLVEKLMAKNGEFVNDTNTLTQNEIENHRYEIIEVQEKFEKMMYHISETKVILWLLNRRLRKLGYLIQKAHDLLDIQSNNHIRLSHFGSIKRKEPSWMISF